jgi:hypothetical protein
MTRRLLAGLVCTVAAFAGCNKPGANAGRFTELCGSTTNMTPEVCRCLGEKAEADLSPQAREFLVATLEKQGDRVIELPGKLSVEETMKAGMFMVNGPRACGGSAADLPSKETTP